MNMFYTVSVYTRETRLFTVYTRRRSEVIIFARGIIKLISGSFRGVT